MSKLFAAFIAILAIFCNMIANCLARIADIICHLRARVQNRPCCTLRPLNGGIQFLQLWRDDHNKDRQHRGERIAKICCCGAEPRVLA
jgi:hypothetical protein